MNCNCNYRSCTFGCDSPVSDRIRNWCDNLCAEKNGWRREGHGHICCNISRHFGGFYQNFAVFIFGLFIELKLLIMRLKFASSYMERRKKEATVTFTCEVLSQLDVLKTSLENHGTIAYKEYIVNKALQGDH